MESAAPLSFGLVLPSRSDEAAARVEALATWLGANTDLSIVVRSAATYKDLAESVREGSSDVAWLPPVAYAWLAEAVSPVGSIVREGRTSYTAALVVLEGSPIRALSDLREARAGWVDTWSAAGYVVPRLELARAGIDPQVAFREEKFHGTHRDALLALGRGECDLVGTFARVPPEGEAVTEGAWSELPDLSVRVLATFGSIPADVLAVRRNLPPSDYARVREGFRRACADASARPIVRAVFGGDELREGIDRGHDRLRRAYESAMANGLFD